MNLLSVIKEVFPNTPRNLINRFTSLENDLIDNGIYTRARLSNFISQIGHESQGFSKLEENLNYSSKRMLEVFPSHFTKETASLYEYNPKKFASKVYANRMGNGPESSEEGWKYRGRGLIQLTGKNNYLAFGKSIGYDIENDPDYVSTPQGAVKSAIWYWKVNNCNDLADIRDVRSLTKRINGGHHGLEERNKLEILAYNKLENFQYATVSIEPVREEPIPPKKEETVIDFFRRIFTRR